MPATLDKNGDGKVVFGVATPGPRDDGAYYQALVDGVTKFSEDNGFETPVVVDNIPAADAATQLENLARQNVDAVMVGAGEISDPLNGVGILAATFGTVSKPDGAGGEHRCRGARGHGSRGDCRRARPARQGRHRARGRRRHARHPHHFTERQQRPGRAPAEACPAPRALCDGARCHLAPAGDDGSPLVRRRRRLRRSSASRFPRRPLRPRAPPVKAAAKPANDNDEYIARIERTLSENHPGPGAPPANLKPPTGAMAAPVATADPAAMSAPATTSAAMAAPDPAPGGILDLSMPPPPGIPIPPVDIPNVGPIKI